MPKPTQLKTDLTIDQVDAAYLPALNVGYLSEGMKLLKMMESLCLESLVIEEESQFDDNSYCTVYGVESVELDGDLLKNEEAITALQHKLCKEHDAQLDEFSMQPTIGELTDYMNDPIFTNEVFDQMDIDYQFVYLLMKGNFGINRVALAERIQQVIDKDLPQLAQLTGKMAA